jgi:NADH-quinone oxidoreductase subunit D
LQTPDPTAVSSALTRAGVSAPIEEVAILGVVCRIEPSDARQALSALKGGDLSFDFLVDCFGVDTGEAVDVVYHLRSFTRDEELFVKAAHDYGTDLASVWDIHPAALMPERELAEMFGLTLSGHPNPKRLLTTDGCPPFLRKETAIRGEDEVRHRERQVIAPGALGRTVGSLAPEAPEPVAAATPALQEGIAAPGAVQPVALPAGLHRAPTGVDELQTERLILSMGPQHPSTHGVLRINLEIDGEEVIASECIIGYLHRGIEKLAESRRFNALGTLMDRGDYLASAHAELAAAMATEQLLEVEVPRRANWLRVLVGELSRIASHTTWYGPNGLDAGSMGPFLYVFRDREYILDILEDISGARMMFNYARPGGVVADLTTTAEAKIRKFLKHFAVHIDENDEILMGNEIFQARMKDLGVFSREGALAFGLTGGNLRASGVDYDVRRDRPYAAYSEMDFEVPVSDVGDAYARCRVRLDEMRQAARMIEQCIDGLPEGEFTAKVPKVLRPPAGEAYAAVESPRGELGVHMISDGSDTPYRMRYRPPALFALQAGEQALPGTLIADSVVLMGSLDFVLGEIDR